MLCSLVQIQSSDRPWLTSIPQTRKDRLSEEDPPAAANMSTITAATIVPCRMHDQTFQMLTRAAAASRRHACRQEPSSTAVRSQQSYHEGKFQLAWAGGSPSWPKISSVTAEAFLLSAISVLAAAALKTSSGLLECACRSTSLQTLETCCQQMQQVKHWQRCWTL